MTTITLSGAGILGGVVLDDSPEVAARDHEERRMQEAQAAELAAWELDQQQLRDQIDAAIFPHLKAELEAENATQRVSATDKQRYKQFQSCCETWNFPALPAPAQAVAVWLAEESVHGATHISRLARSISVVHRALNFSDPTEDVLIRALLRQARNETNQNNQKG